MSTNGLSLPTTDIDNVPYYQGTFTNILDKKLFAKDTECLSAGMNYLASIMKLPCQPSIGLSRTKRSFDNIEARLVAHTHQGKAVLSQKQYQTDLPFLLNGLRKAYLVE